MKDFRHLPGVSTLVLDREKCVGCGLCPTLCPHGVLAMDGGKARVVDFDACMECGACALNCPSGALSVTPGVGCATYILKTWLPERWRRDSPTCC